jgi:hypothetical protein
MRRGGGRLRNTLLAVLGAVLLVLVLAQLLLPGIVAGRIASRLRRYGTVQSVHVSAWPAVKLLWGQADSVDVRAGSLAIGSASRAAGLLAEAHGAQSMQLSAASVRLGRVQMSDASLRKQGSALTAQALISAAAVTAALPPGVTLKLLGSSGGSVRVLAGGGLFGAGISVEALAAPSAGALVAHPVGLLLEGFRLTLFSDPHVQVQGVGAEPAPGVPGAYRVMLAGSLR